MLRGWEHGKVIPTPPASRQVNMNNPCSFILCGSMTRSVYIMRKWIYSRLKNNYGKVECKICGKPIRLNQKVVSTRNHSRKPTKLYHYKCWIKLWR